MIFNKKNNRETHRDAMNVISQENRRLKQENQRLRESLNELQRYKDEYRRLTEEVNLIKERYSEGIGRFDELKKSYENELGKLKGGLKWHTNTKNHVR